MKSFLLLNAAVAAAMILATSAGAASPAGVTKHQRDTIRFFAHHPRLAQTPAGQRALWQMLGNVVDQLRTLQSSRTLQATSDWQTAVRVVQRVYPGSQDWLLSCSSSEGGWGRWVSNTLGSGAGGWMQFMEGTFWGDYHAAVADLRSRRVVVPASSASWYSPLGQAIAAGWAYGHDRPTGKWTGSRC